jgi:hypothetical protein
LHLVEETPLSKKDIKKLRDILSERKNNYGESVDLLRVAPSSLSTSRCARPDYSRIAMDSAKEIVSEVALRPLVACFGTIAPARLSAEHDEYFQLFADPKRHCSDRRTSGRSE